MKRRLTGLLMITGILLSVSAIATHVFAAESEGEVKAQQVEDLKERLATKVAELAQTEDQAIAGIVKEVSVSTISIESATRQVSIELTDDITVAQNINGKRTSLTIDDIDIDDRVVVFGKHDTTLDLLKAQLIFIQNTVPRHVAGLVSEVDEDNFTITISSHDGQEYTIDYERSTDTDLWDSETGERTEGGFSKITVGDTIHVVATPVEDETNRLTGVRIVNIGAITGAKEDEATPAAEEETEVTEATPAVGE